MLSKEVVKIALQAQYDNLMCLADMAHLNSKNVMITGLQGEWTGKAEAYEYAASCLDTTAATFGVYLVTSNSLRQKESKPERKESNQVPETYNAN